MEIKIYEPSLKNDWNTFVSLSKNGTFLFHRGFMDYHSHRFTDNSLLFYSKRKLIALLPANRVGTTLYSHQGLTYGGLILSSDATTPTVIELFSVLIAYLKAEGINTLIYKTIPSIYHQQAAEEDLYALFRLGATLAARNISSVVYLDNKIEYAELRKRGVKKAEKNGLIIEEATDFSSFWSVLDNNLQAKYNTKPVHTLDEISALKSIFSDQIRLFQAKKNGSVLAGVVVFEMQHTAHIQYISANDEGKKSGALDLLFNHLINEVYPHKKFFDFGISTEQGGFYLNQGLISQKEGFGARGIVYDTYQLNVNELPPSAL